MIKRIKQFLRRKESKKRAEMQRQREKDIRFNNQMVLSKEYGKNEN